MTSMFSRTLSGRPWRCRIGRHAWRPHFRHVSFCRRCPATKAFDVVAQRERVYLNTERVR